MSEHKEPIPSMIYNAAIGGHVTNSQQIIDENLNREQQDINEEVAAVPYNTSNPNGMGKIVLKKNDNFKEVVEAQINGNTIFVIKYDFTLTGNVTIPTDCILEFDGGSINGSYTLTSTNTGIQAGLVKIFNTDVSLAGTWNVIEAYPEWFGAKGDGATDDTNSIKQALYNVNNKLTPLVFQSDKKYIISGPLNIHNNTYYDVTAIILGTTSGVAKVKNCGIILVNKNESIFKEATIKGKICGISFLCDTNSHTTDNTSVFYKCRLYSLCFENCIVEPFNSFLLGSKVLSVSRIQGNRIWAHYFARPLVEGNTKHNCHLVDSFIDNNRILGQTDAASKYMNVDNICFGFNAYGGSYIRNNFIDYFRVIYDPGELGISSGNINSMGNQYQVFRYFYKNISRTKGNNAGSLNSIGDAFNWTVEGDPSENIMDKFTKDEYTGFDGNTYTVPTYILRVEDKAHVKIKDCVLEGKLGNIVFVWSSILSYDTDIEFTCNVSGWYMSEHNNKIPVERRQGTTDGRTYIISSTDINKIRLPKFCMDTVSELLLPVYKTSSVPKEGTYTKYLVGEEVLYQNNIYRLRYTSERQFAWIRDNEFSR